MALKALTEPLCKTAIELRKRFVKALSTPVSRRRGDYGHLLEEERCRDIIRHLNRRAPGEFTEYVDFDKKGRGGYVKFSLLLLDHARKLAVLQGRQYLQWKSIEHSTARHNYYLVGLTDEGRTFTHPISGQIAWRLVDLWDAGEDWYGAFLRWAFKIDDPSKIIRQGDVALVVMKRKPGGLEWHPRNEVKINDSHVLRSAEEMLFARKGSREYVVVHNNAVLVHLRNQHDTVLVQPGVYRIEVAITWRLWNFSGRVAD